MKSLVAFYSRAGQNYFSGKLKYVDKGNTEIIADYIIRSTGADKFKIQQRVPYSDDYNLCIAQAKDDQKNVCYPDLEHDINDLDEYDIIYLGYPNYWGTAPMAVFSFLKAHDFTGKTIRPFCTHEGSGYGKSINDIKKFAKGASVENGIDIKGSNVSNASETVKKWLGLQ